jgi:hypothetical protein
MAAVAIAKWCSMSLTDLLISRLKRVDVI